MAVLCIDWLRSTWHLANNLSSRNWPECVDGGMGRRLGWSERRCRGGDVVWGFNSCGFGSRGGGGGRNVDWKLIWRVGRRVGLGLGWNWCVNLSRGWRKVADKLEPRSDVFRFDRNIIGGVGLGLVRGDDVAIVFFVILTM